MEATRGGGPFVVAPAPSVGERPGTVRTSRGGPASTPPAMPFPSARPATATPSAPAAPPLAREITVNIANFVYLPDPVRIPLGGRVRWVNLDPEQHTATANSQAWTSPVLNQGQVYERVFVQAGTYGYFCEPHPQMTADIVVE
ncbi:MAG: plastocyanin/azurin family copper-binding protein [Chloroflexota bacterium]